MPEIETENNDEVVAVDPPAVVESPDGHPPVVKDAADKGDYLLTFKNREEAEHGYKELQARATRAEQERSITAAKLEILERMSKPSYDDKTSDAQKAFDSQVMEQLDANPRTALKLIRDAGSVVMDLTRREIAALEQRIMERLELADPEAQANKADIERVMSEYGVTSSQAKGIVLKELIPSRAKTVKQPERAKIPASKKATGAADEDGGDDIEIPGHLMAQLNAMSFSDAEKKEIIAGMKKDLAKKGQ